jgi:hypothetical protein
MWVIVAMSLLVVSAAVHRMWRAGGPPDLGSVTERWLVEHRSHRPGEWR